MKRILIWLTVLALSPLVPSTASASAPAPSWAGQTGLPAGFTWGNWLPCQSEYQLTDCIESVSWIKSDGTRVSGVWTPKPDFKFSNFKQSWYVDDNGETGQDFVESVALAGSYTFEGLTTPCGDSNIVIDARPVRGGFQVNGKPTCNGHFQSIFEERFVVSLNSKFLKGFVGGVSSTGRNPQILFSTSSKGDVLTITANFAYTAWSWTSENGIRKDVCKRNEYKADGGGWGFWNVIYWAGRNGDQWLAQHPGDMISGTNGWNCGGAMYWDAAEQGLVMQVGSPHYDVDGSVIEGWFEGAIRGRYITQRFGIQPGIAAGRAQLEIVYNDGVKKIATITAKYDAASDWLYLKGYGFTYSNPKLIVKFGNSAVQKSITCVKGKVTKKITSTKPLCPAGFKIK
ncbi:hypothetical protein MCEMRE182_01409 [Candidatus Nanopelagicaceae bacterium]